MQIEDYRKMSIAVIEMKERSTNQHDKELLAERLAEIQMKIAMLKQQA